jgi:O-antigen/teichoic acid export membrane protein
MGLKKSISLNFISQVVNLIAGIGSSILLARVLGPEGRGDYILIITSAGFLVQFFSFGIESTISHYVASKKIEFPILFYWIGIVVLCLALTSIIGTIIIATISSEFLLPTNDINYFIILILLILFMFLNGVFSSILSGTRNFRSVILIGTLTQLFILISAAIFFLVVGHDSSYVIPILYSTVGVYCFMTIAYSISYLRFVGLRPVAGKISKSQFKSFFTYSIISFLCSVLQFLSYKMDYWVVNYYWGPISLGIYSLGASLSQLLWLLPQSISTILFPMTSYYQREELTELTARILRISLFVTLLLVVPLIILSPFFIPLLFGSEFNESVYYFQLFLLGIFPFIIIKILASVFAGMGKVKYNLIATVTGFLAGGICYIILIPTIGLIGGVIGSIFSYVVTTSVGIHLFRREYRIHISDLLFIKRSDFTYLLVQVGSLILKKSK